MRVVGLGAPFFLVLLDQAYSDDEALTTVITKLCSCTERRHSAGTGGRKYRNSQNFGVRIYPADTGERAFGIRTAEVRRREDRKKRKTREGGERTEEERKEGR